VSAIIQAYQKENYIFLILVVILIALCFWLPWLIEALKPKEREF